MPTVLDCKSVFNSKYYKFLSVRDDNFCHSIAGFCQRQGAGRLWGQMIRSRTTESMKSSGYPSSRNFHFTRFANLAFL